MRTLILLLALPLMLGSCGLLGKWFTKKPKPNKDAGMKDVYIGTVEMVNPEQHFVLIHTGMKLDLQPGWKLETRPVSGNKSVLTVSAEQKLNFLSADITVGYPEKGEIVVMPPQSGLLPATGPAQPGFPPVPPANISTLPPPIP